MTYTFKCTAHKEPQYAYVEQSMKDELKAPMCATCGGPTVRVYDAPPVSWMGSGWAGKDR